MRQNARSLMVVFALLIMMLSSACSNNQAPVSSSGTPAKEGAGATAGEGSGKEVVTIKILEEVNLGGVDVSDAVSQEIERKLGIKLEYVTMDKDKFKVMAATGELGDIVIVGKEYQKQFIDGGAVIALDDLLQAGGQDIIKNSPNKIAFSKKYLSEGNDKVFFLPAHGIESVEDFKKMSQFEYQLGAFVRWDYYKELGYPEVNNTDDYLNVLADMQRKHPKTADGKKTYPISLWTDWGNIAMLESYNYGVSQLKSLVDFYDEKGAMKESLLSDDAFLWKTLRFYNKAHKMGLLDPDSFTQKYENVKQKMINGQTFTNNNSWDNGTLNPELAKNFGPDAGMGMIPTAYPAAFSNSFSPIGWATSFSAAISKNSKYPERAMELLNYLNSYDGARLVYSGIKGVHWDEVDGKAEMKAEVLGQSGTDPDFLKKSGIKRSTLDHLVGLDRSVIDPVDGTPVDLFILPEALVLKNTPFNKAYSDHFGVTYPGAAVEKAAQDGKIRLGLFNTIAVDMMPPLPDDLNRINKQIDDYLSKLTPKVALADSEEEADKLIASAKEDLKSFGIDKLTQWDAAEYQKSQAAANEVSQ